MKRNKQIYERSRMISKFRKMIVVAAAVLTLLAPVAISGSVFAQDDKISQGLCTGTNLDLNQTSCDDGGVATDKVNGILTDVINIFSIVVGVVAVVMIILGGLKYITSGGDSSNVSGAKNTIIYALVGLVIVALAQFIVHYVLAKATSTTA